MGFFNLEITKKIKTRYEFFSLESEVVNHSFNIELAKQFGVNAAIILENIIFWIAKNKANNHNLFDGRYWVYNSVRAWNELFPYLTRRKIQLALNRLEKNGVLLTGNYNKMKADRTKWYTLTDKYLYLIDNKHLTKCENHLTKSTNAFNKMCNPFNKIDQPLPIINSFINTNINNKDSESQKTDTPDYQFFFDKWNAAAKHFGLSKIMKLSKKRKNKIKARCKDKDFRESFIKCLRLIDKSNFLQGENESNWKITFDWLIANDNNWIKVIEGNYTDKKTKKDKQESYQNKIPTKRETPEQTRARLEKTRAMLEQNKKRNGR
jgi:hypothetical protein